MKKVYTLDNKLKRHYIDTTAFSGKSIEELCKFIKRNYGIGAYYTNKYTIVVEPKEIRYFTSLCN